MQLKMNKPKVALCLIVKLENLYLKEYIEYYKNKIGINHIYIYDNNDIDAEKSENIHDVTQEYENENYVTVIDVRGKTNYHKKAYIECYNNFGELYDWMCFFDADEFLYLPEQFKNIQSYLSYDVFNNFSMIVVPWVFYGDSDKLLYENKPVQERFIIPAYRYDLFHDNAWVKSIIRTKLDNINWDDTVPFSSPHIPNMLFNLSKDLPLKICGVHGQQVYPSATDVGNICKNINYEVHLKHYWCKSTEEYILKRLRGVTDREVYEFNLDNEIELYFRKNTFSMSKLRVMIDTFNKYKEKMKFNNVKIV